jgi:hypothetical protein
VAATRGRLEGRIKVPTGGWTATVGAGTATIAAGYYYASHLLQAVAIAFAAAASTTCTATASLGESGTGLVTITFGSAKAVTWISTDLRDLLGFTGNLSSGTSHVGTQAMRSVWLPGCAYHAPNDVSKSWRGWREGDKRTVGNPAGYAWSHMGEEKVATRLLWERVPRSKTWIGNEATVNASYERWFRDCVWGVAAWGTAGGPVRFYPDAASMTCATYRVPDASMLRPRAFFTEWAGGPWVVELPRLVEVPGLGRRFPATSAEWAAIYPGIKTPTNLWPVQDSSAPLTDVIGSAPFTTVSGTISYQKLGEPGGRYAFEIATDSSYIRTGTASDYNMGAAGSGKRMTLWFRFRIPALYGSTRTFYANMNLNVGHRLSVLSDGSLRFDCQDGTDNVYATIEKDHCDGEWHDVMVVVDRSTETSYAISDLGRSGVQDLAAGSIGSMSNNNYLRIGGATVSSPDGAQIAQVVGWYGSTADLAITEAEFHTLRRG